jgi:hypothetical protein
MGKSDLVQKVGGPIHCWSRGPKSWGGGPVPPVPMVVAPMVYLFDRTNHQLLGSCS